MSHGTILDGSRTLPASQPRQTGLERIAQIGGADGLADVAAAEADFRAANLQA